MEEGELEMGKKLISIWLVTVSWFMLEKIQFVCLSKVSKIV